MAKNVKNREQKRGSTKPVELPQEQITAAKIHAGRLREKQQKRELSVPEGTPEDAKTIHDFDAWAEGYETLHLCGEDETEVVRQYRECFGITATNIKVNVAYHGNDPRPKPRQDNSTSQFALPAPK